MVTLPAAGGQSRTTTAKHRRRRWRGCPRRQAATHEFQGQRQLANVCVLYSQQFAVGLVLVQIPSTPTLNSAFASADAASAPHPVYVRSPLPKMSDFWRSLLKQLVSVTSTDVVQTGGVWAGRDVQTPV